MKQRTITLTDRRPITIDEDEWPFIVQLERPYEADARPACKPRPARLIKLKMRQHADGRVIVYGIEQRDRGDLGNPVGYYVADYSREDKAHVAPSDQAIVVAIKQVAHELDAPELAPLAIAELPAERI